MLHCFHIVKEEDFDGHQINKINKASKNEENFELGVSEVSEETEEESESEDSRDLEEESSSGDDGKMSEEKDSEDEKYTSESDDEENDSGPDLARGKGNIETSSEDEDDSTEIFPKEPEIVHEWGELAKDVPHADKVRQRSTFLRS